MAWQVYDQILQVVGADQERVQAIRALYNQVIREFSQPEPALALRSAERELKPAGLPRPARPAPAGGAPAGRPRPAAVGGARRGANAEVSAELPIIESEQEFMAQLRELKRRSGKGLRSVAQEMVRVNPHQALSKSSLGELFRRDTVPRNAKQLEILLHVLTGSAKGYHPLLVNHYLQQWNTIRGDHARPADALSADNPNISEPPPNEEERPADAREPAGWHIRVTLKHIALAVAVIVLIFALGVLTGGLL